MSSLEICSICLEKVCDPDVLYNPDIIPAAETACGNCGNIFHQVCIKQWIKVANTCPICRE